jgi:hypothetical protein
MESIYVIYKDGKRLTKDEAGMNVKIVYLKEGAAKGIVTTLVNDYVHFELDLWSSDGKDKYEEALSKERSRYEVVEYVRKQK